MKIMQSMRSMQIAPLAQALVITGNKWPPFRTSIE